MDFRLTKQLRVVEWLAQQSLPESVASKVVGPLGSPSVISVYERETARVAYAKIAQRKNVFLLLLLPPFFLVTCLPCYTFFFFPHIWFATVLFR